MLHWSSAGTSRRCPEGRTLPGGSPPTRVTPPRSSLWGWPQCISKLSTHRCLFISATHQWTDIMAPHVAASAYPFKCHESNVLMFSLFFCARVFACQGVKKFMRLVSLFRLFYFFFSALLVIKVKFWWNLSLFTWFKLSDCKCWSFFFFLSFHPYYLSLDLVPQMSPRESCSREELQEKWIEMKLPIEQLDTLLSLGNFGSDINWMPFFAHACTALGGVRNTTPLQFNWQVLMLSFHFFSV